MTMRRQRRYRALSSLALSAFAAITVVGCSGSGSGDQTADAPADVVALDGVQVDVRRDPG